MGVRAARRGAAASLVAYLFHIGRAARVGASRAFAEDAALLSAAESEKPALRIFVSTFNTGNSKFEDDSRFRGLVDQLSRGHGDSDIVLMGFQEFHDSGAGFAELVKGRLWKDQSQHRQQELTEELRGLVTPPPEVASQRDSIVSYLKSKDEALNATMAAIDIKEIEQKMYPLHKWTKDVLQGIDDIWPRFPNLQYNDEGSMSVNKFTRNLDRVDQTQKQVIAKTEILRALENGNLHTGPNPKLARDWAAVEQALGDLQADLAGGSSRGWSDGLAAEVQGLLEEAVPALGIEHVVIPLEQARYASGLRCHAAKHFDTFMYAFVNPWSGWKIAPDPYASSRCTGSGSGCTIDNNNGLECGKVVNLLRFKVTREGASLRLCALNTHMSFAGTAQQRLHMLEEAMDEAREASCDSIVFVGDFNTRLHCQQEGTLADKPIPATEGGQGMTSMDNVLSQFKQADGGYKLSGSPRHLDELAQMLDNEEVNCFEQQKKKDSWFGKKEVTWNVTTSHSSLPSLGLFEAPVNFGPTYKVASEDEAQKAKMSHCSKDSRLCYVNPSGKWKHNPAWTDRVLVQADPQRAQVEVTEYNSREPPTIAVDQMVIRPPTVASDHIPVVAQVVFRPV